MNFAPIVTGEAVALELRPAALPSRFVAGAIDAAIQLSFVLLIAGTVEATAGQLPSASARILVILVLVVTLIGYPVTFESLMRGRTPGKAAMGLRVVRDDGGPIGFRQALVRGLVGGFVERPGLTLFLGGVLCSLLNSQGKRIGDLLAGTIVLHERVAVRGGHLATMPPPLVGWAAGLDLSGISDPLALSVRQFVSRADQLTPAAREQIGGGLVQAVLAVVGPAPAGTPGSAVLSAVLAERRRRETDRLSGAPRYRPEAGAGAGAGAGAPAPPLPVNADGFAPPA